MWKQIRVKRLLTAYKQEVELRFSILDQYEIPKPIKCRLFADDLNISLSTRDVTTLQNLQTWSDIIGLQFFPEKCKCMIFTRKNTIKFPDLHLNNVKLPFVRKSKLSKTLVASKC